MVVKQIGLFLVSSLLVIGCKDDKPKTDTTPVAAAPSAPAPVASAPAPVASVAPLGKMAHCPSAVTGASTEIKDSKDGVTVTVTAKDAAQTSDIRARAKFLSESAKNMTPDVKHNGSGEGGGVFGRCPVVMRNTTVDTKDVEGGSEISVRPKDPKELDFVRREARERNVELAMPGASPDQGAGQGKMGHCPSAVEKATTTVKDTKDGVQVDVVGKDDATTKDIRARAKLLMDAAKLDPSTVTHKGNGSGGGGLGRCPVVLKDTTIEAKEIPGGESFIVKPTKQADAPLLRKESRDRAANFVASK